jgi:tetratricopeptide (TPR) repeat protein
VDLLIKLARAYRRVIRLPWMASRSFALVDALEREDWLAASEIVRSLHRAKFASATTHLYLGYANAQLGVWQEAVNSFERVEPSKIRFNSDRAIYCNWFAYALHMAGQPDRARTHLTESAHLWPAHSSRWATAYLEGESTEQSAPDPSSCKLRLLH